jgi:hypothetical protein
MFALNLTEFVTLWQSTRSGARPYMITSQFKSEVLLSAHLDALNL